jgi:hypothetical protein
MARAPKQKIECIHCGEFFASTRKSCPHCGSDSDTGWQSDEDIQASSVPIPESYLSDQDYDRFLSEQTFTEQGAQRALRRKLLVLLLILVLISIALW